MSAQPSAVQDVREDPRQQLISDVRAGLLARPKRLPSRWFYDRRGSELFEEITELPEYYLTRTETEILRQHADEIAKTAQPEVLVELGSGTSAKSRLLIDAARRYGSIRVFVPFDIDEDTIGRTAAALAAEFPGLVVQGIAGDFMRHLDAIPRTGRKLVIFLGSTVGNLDDEARARFLTQVRNQLRTDDALLIGFDLVKDAREMVAAYDDSQGLTAEFNRNLLRRLNRELGADFDLNLFTHLAIWNAEQSRIEIYLRAVRDQVVHLPGASLQVDFAGGETVRTEISVKFTRPAVDQSFGDAGLALDRWITDAHGRFALAMGRLRG
jgi:L-histidine N-alpha-methyltransferase